MKFLYNWLQEYFNEKLPKPEKLAELLTMASFEVEEIKKSGKDCLFDIDILPNRMPDASGHEGVAGEIAAIFNLKFKNENLKTTYKNLKLSNKKYLEIKIENKDLCPRYTARMMRNVKVGPSPKWLKERLELLGINSINNIVDAANYIMLKTGQPCHIFDFDKVKNMEIPNSIRRGGQIPNKSQILNSKSETKKIIIRKAKNGEKITTLDNKEYELDDTMLVIADSKDPLAIAGIKGGKKAEVGAKTKNIILESANFSHANIRKTSQKLNLQTDASKRFSYNIDPNLAEEASGRLAAFIQELAGGEIVGGLSDVYPKKVVPTIIKLNFDKVRKVLGSGISDKEIKDILRRLGFKLRSVGFGLSVIVPTIRRDITIEEDLIEEIGRIHGYENIKQAHPAGELIPPQKNDILIISKAVKNFLVGQGFAEIYSYSFIGERDLELLEQSAKKNIIELQNPLSPELKFLTPSLLFNILKAASLNLKNYDEFRLFELGKVFFPREEKRHLAGVLTEKDSDNKKLFYRIKGVLSSLFEALGIDDAWFDDIVEKTEITPLTLSFSHPQRISQIKIGDEIAGIFGEFRSDVLAHYDAKKRSVAFFEIDFGILAEKAEEEREFRPFSKFPSIIRDLSLFVPNETRIAEVENIIEARGGGLLVDTDLFDIYGDERFEGKKSLAFHFIFQSDERTLSDAEVDKIMNKIIITLEQNPDWEVRK